MPIVSGEITKEGAIIDVMVGGSKARRSALQRLELPVPPRMAVRVQLDTGSFATGFMPEVFETLGIQPIDRVAIRTPSTRRGESCLVDQFDVNLAIVSGTDQYTIGVWAIASEHFEQGYEVQAIIGRDLLASWPFP